jgi:ectoine hydroxylase-related dioxygenase (phytanoyl-CoA dioxygenase family)
VSYFIWSATRNILGSRPLNWRNKIELHGYSIIPEVTLGAETAGLLDSLQHTNLHRSKAGIRHVLKDDSIAAFAQNAQLLAIAKTILGPEAFPFHATLFDKSPDANWLVVWHQDTALPLSERRETAGWGPWSVKEGVIYAHAPADALSRVLALRVHLDDSTIEDGLLRVLPGTHDRGVLTDDAIHELAAQVAPVNCEVARGGVLAMRPLIVHSSPKSQSKIPRRVLHIEYAASREAGDGLQLAIA